MPATEPWLRNADDRAKRLEGYGVFWRHDGNERRPYVRLRSGLVSNGYFNGAVLGERSALLAYTVQELVVEYLQRRDAASPLPRRIIGPAMGAITLAHEVARWIDNMHILDGTVRMSFAEKDGDAFRFKRSPPLPGERLLFVEDTITTAGSVRKVKDAATELLGSFAYDPYLLVLCNRTGMSAIDDLEVVSFVDANFRTWEEGDNPFTKGGRELVPVVENAKDNWHLLTQDYPA